MPFKLPDTMPSLNLSIPAERSSTSSIELNESLLRHWLDKLPKNNLPQLLEIYHDALQRFNGNQVPLKDRLLLLDMYRGPLNQLLFTLTPAELRRQIRDSQQRRHIIDALGELMNQLAIGYKIVIVEAGQVKANLDRNPLGHMAIYRACEQLSYLALHNYKFYRSMPAKLFRECHQLYLLCDIADVANKPPFVTSQYQATDSLAQRYAQIMLLSISNPYGLYSGDVLTVYKLLRGLAAYTEIAPLPDDGKPVAGQFYINCLSDRTPLPSILPSMDDDQRPPTLMLNTKPVLMAVDNLFQQTAQDHGLTGQQLSLIRQLAPFLNTSYQRKQQRVEFKGSKQAYFAVGLPAVHQALLQREQLSETHITGISGPWEILNKNDFGYLLSCYQADASHDLQVGDFVGIVETADAEHKALSRLAMIRWLRSDDQDLCKVGVALLEGEPLAIQYAVDGNTDLLQPGLLIPELPRLHQAATLVTARGVFRHGRSLTIKTTKKRFSFNIIADSLLTQNADFERFSFKDAPLASTENIAA
ncbi:MAG: hypothetical protein RQ732_05680 [Methylophaga sp.]|nr:hypothetical protein [Methylophaga sp.]